MHAERFSDCLFLTQFQGSEDRQPQFCGMALPAADHEIGRHWSWWRIAIFESPHRQQLQQLLCVAQSSHHFESTTVHGADHFPGRPGGRQRGRSVLSKIGSRELPASLGLTFPLCLAVCLLPCVKSPKLHSWHVWALMWILQELTVTLWRGWTKRWEAWRWPLAYQWALSSSQGDRLHCILWAPYLWSVKDGLNK